VAGFAGCLALVMTAVVPTSLLAAGPQPDPCTFLTGWSPPSGAQAAAGQPITVDGGESTLCNFIFDYPDSWGTSELVNLTLTVTRYKPGAVHPDSVTWARNTITYQATQEGLASAAYGDVGFEGTMTGGNFAVFHVFFTIHNYSGVVASNAKISPAAQAEARKLEAAMRAAIGPPDDAAAGSAAPGAFQVGIGCAEDGAFLRCTASPSGAPAGASLVYSWAIDGVAQAAGGARLEIDLKAAGIAAGDHQISVTATDSASGQSATASQAMRTTGGSGGSSTDGGATGSGGDIPIVPIGVGAALLLAAAAANAARKSVKGARPQRPVAAAATDVEVADGLTGLVADAALEASATPGPTEAEIKEGGIELLESVPSGSGPADPKAPAPGDWKPAPDGPGWAETWSDSPDGFVREWAWNTGVYGSPDLPKPPPGAQGDPDPSPPELPTTADEAIDRE
jgi:hypothetical protein